jgi:hypothetical protein
MHDFTARVGASVQAAREVQRQQQEALRREEEGTARRLQQGRERASELVGTTWDRIRMAAHASDGALTVQRSETKGVTVFEVGWQEGQPDRSLRITVDQPEGTIQAAWLVPTGHGRMVDAPSVAASGFDISMVETVILILVDQPRWARSVIPTIPW